MSVIASQNRNGVARKATPLFLTMMLLLTACGSPFASIFIDPAAEGLTAMTKQRILAAQETLTEKPDDTKTALSLAAEYLQAVRESADTGYYRRTEGMVKHVEKLESGNPEVRFLRGQIFMGKHDFASALPLGQALVTEYPDVHRYYGLLADAQTEMGMYDEAVVTLQRMADLRPDNAVLTRIAYAREIHGDFDGAVEAMQEAAGVSSGVPEQDAWILTELGRLALPVNTETGKRYYQAALAIYPNSAAATAGVARAAAFAKDYPEAEKQALAAFELQPLPEYSALLGDIYMLMDKPAKAELYYTLTEAGYDGIAAAGTNVDLERAKFLAERGRDPALALKLAMAVHAERPTIYSADVLSVAFSQNKQGIQAWKYAIEALKTKSKDPMLLYHAAIAAQTAGETSKAKTFLADALKRPYFSVLDAADAKSWLDQGFPDID
jgi:tetratricopeptide (TPR) repeat protein